MHKVILLRHGQSVWNQENRFTGWTDVGLTERGIEEAVRAGRLLVDEGYTVDIAFTSLLKRAIKTLWLVLEEMDQMWVPVRNDWHLNERHYGALQGLDKKETADEHGIDQVKIWRRSYSTRPPAVDQDDPRYPGNDARYASLSGRDLPQSECLKDTVDRVLPYWNTQIIPEIRAGKTVLVSAHGNSLRALVKHLDNITDEDIAEFNIPTGIPLVYELGEDLKAVRHRYLGDPDQIAEATREVANQLKKGGSSA